MPSYSTVLVPVSLHTFARMYQVYQGHIFNKALDKRVDCLKCLKECLKANVPRLGGVTHGIAVRFTPSFCPNAHNVSMKQMLVTISSSNAFLLFISASNIMQPAQYASIYQCRNERARHVTPLRRIFGRFFPIVVNLIEGNIEQLFALHAIDIVNSRLDGRIRFHPFHDASQLVARVMVVG